MATCDLNRVLANKDFFKGLTRQQFEIVITRFNEALVWTDGIEHLCTVYNKGEPFSKGDCKIVPVPNNGIGLETMLRHMNEQYYNLADATFFCQATLCDRVDQPLYTLETYAKCGLDEIVCVKEDLCERPDFRFKWRASNPQCLAVNDRNFGQWRSEVLEIPYRGAYESWVKGDWICAGRERIRKRPRSFYANLYNACQFGRGIQVEECWFLERSFHSILSGLGKPQKNLTYGRL
jgi:hypothetical protein